MKKIVVSLLLGLAALASNAKPAYWYRWESQADGHLVCAQVPPGKAWQKFSGPYRDAACSLPVR